jgi:hypothetical protein
MKYAFLLLVIPLLYSCWPRGTGDYTDGPPMKKVWGNKPVYATEITAKQIQYIAQPQSLLQAGNIYAFGKYIFQVDVGRGIHVIDNSEPSKADRIGFITVSGCSQISIKGSYLYTNSLDDLVTLDMSDPVHLKEVSRVKNAFPEFRYNYPLVQPEESGYYLCPRMDSVVVGWVKDSIYTGCFKN